MNDRVVDEPWFVVEEDLANQVDAANVMIEYYGAVKQWDQHKRWIEIYSVLRRIYLQHLGLEF